MSIGGVSIIWGTGLRSTEAVGVGGGLCGGGDFRISGMLAVLDRLVASSLLKIESNVDGTDELRLEDAASRPAGLEKFVGAAFVAPFDVEGSFKVCARFPISMDTKFGRGGIVGRLASGDSGLLPEGLPAAALLAARCAYVPRSPLPFTLPPRR